MTSTLNSLMSGGWDPDESDFEYNPAWDEYGPADDVDDTGDHLYHPDVRPEEGKLENDQLPF